jgi:DNA-binding SARP family transcriptional activator
MQINLFGATVVEGPVGRVEGTQLGGAKPRQLLQLLALEHGAAVPKERLADRLWDGRPPAAFVTTLESYICLLRRRLGLVGPHRSLLETSRSGYRLDPVRVRVDVAQARVALGSERPLVVARGMALAGPGLLADEPEARWAMEEREAFSRLLVDRCTESARRANLSRQPELAARLARTAVDHGYACEPAVRELMRALWRLDARIEALDAYADLRTTLDQGFGLEPAPATRRVYLSILRSAAMHRSRAVQQGEVRALLKLLVQAVEYGGSGTDLVARRFVEAGQRLLTQPV